MHWYAHRINSETDSLEKRITGVCGPFSAIDEISAHYATQLLKWPDDRLAHTESYFRQLSNGQTGYFDFLIAHKHLFVFDTEPAQDDIQNVEEQLKT